MLAALALLAGSASSAQAEVRTGLSADARDQVQDPGAIRRPDIEQLRVAYDRGPGTVSFVFRLYEPLAADAEHGIYQHLQLGLLVGRQVGPGQACGLTTQDGDLSFSGYFSDGSGEWYSRLRVNGSSTEFFSDGSGSSGDGKLEVSPDGREFKFVVANKPQLANRDYRCVGAIALRSPGRDEVRNLFFEGYAPPGPAPDTTAPTVAFSAPTAGQTLAGALNEPGAAGATSCAVDAADNQAIDRVEFFVDGNALNTEVRAPYTCFWNTASAPNGAHTLSAVAYDRRGNSRPASVSVNVSNPPPPAGPPPRPLARLVILGESGGGRLSRLRVRRHSLWRLLSTGLSVSLRCPGPCKASLVLKVDRAGPGKLRSGMVIGRALRELSRAGHKRVVVRLTHRAKRLLRKRRWATVRLRTTITDSAGMRRAVTQTLPVRR